MKISYAILACNEVEELDRLLRQLKTALRGNDEIVVMLDAGNYPPGIKAMVEDHGIHPHERALEGNFAKQKNALFAKCGGDFIVNLDADELLSDYLCEFMHEILEYIDPAIDVVNVPRINTVEGLTHDHVRRWGWRVDANGWVNFPDWQRRIVRTGRDIRWERPVHEVLVGWRRAANLPAEPDYCIIHPKDIARQERQNAYYDTIPTE